MSKMSVAEAKLNLTHLYGVVDQGYKKSLDIALAAIDTLDRIQGVVDNADETIKASYGVVIVEGYADIYTAIKEILDNEYKM